MRESATLSASAETANKPDVQPLIHNVRSMSYFWGVRRGERDFLAWCHHVGLSSSLLCCGTCASSATAPQARGDRDWVLISFDVELTGRSRAVIYLSGDERTQWFNILIIMVRWRQQCQPQPLLVCYWAIFYASLPLTFDCHCWQE